MSTMTIGGGKPAAKKTVRDSIRFHLMLGLGIVLVLAVGLGGWASTVQISGALIAPGQIVVESNVKKVQHPTGGVVGEVRVRDGDTVKAGDIVVRLDETVVKASLAIVVKTLNGLLARGARLEAEQRGIDKIKFPAALTDRADDPDVRDDAFRFRGRTFGHVVVALPPDRGLPGARRADYHDATLPPRHALLAFALWLRHVAEGGPLGAEIFQLQIIRIARLRAKHQRGC